MLVTTSGRPASKRSADAMADATAGDRLRVRNPATGRVLEGTVQPDGTVAIPP